MWLYVPTTCSPSVPASAGSSSALPSLSDCGERLHEASATWRGKPQPPQVWSRRWKQGGFIRHLSGVTLPPSTLDHGVASFISSLRAIPAKTTASPESAPVPMESDFLPPRSSALPMSAGLILSSARTSRGMLPSSYAPSSRHWSDWATALRQEYSVRPKPATPCAASDCSSWPSAKVATGGYEVQRDGSTVLTLQGAAVMWMAPRAGENEETAESFEARRMRMTPAERMGVNGTLSIQVQQWSSPKASDPEKAGPNMRGSKGDVPLPGQAATWAGPAAQNHKGSSEGSSEGSITRADGKSREDILSYQAEQFFHPPSSPDRPIAGGSTSSTDSPSSNQPSVKRKLNPIFVEALMRWPTGLSGFERQEMAWTRWWLLMPSFVSALCSPPPPAQPTLL